MCGCKAASLTSTKVHSNNCIKGRAPRGPFLIHGNQSLTARQSRDLLLLSGLICNVTAQPPALRHPLQNRPAGQSALLKKPAFAEVQA